MLAASPMCEFASLERCAAYVAARSALIAVQDASVRWPEVLGHRVRGGASDAVQFTAQAISHGHTTAARRQCLREAITAALGVAATVDAARAMGYGALDAAELQRLAGRAVALLAMLLHASTSLAGM